MIHVGNVSEMIYKCIQSLRRHSPDCHILLYTFEKELNHSERLHEFNVQFRELKKKCWDGRRMACKIETIPEVIEHSSDGDRILILDSDLYFQDDPFNMFDDSNDVFLTSRSYKYQYPINAGVWGFVNNNKTRKFIDFFIQQCQNPSWDKLVRMRKDFRRKGNAQAFDWWVDQDFLCMLFEHGPPKEIAGVKVHDVGDRYNFCPSTDKLGNKKAAEILRAEVGNKEVVVLHLKGSLKRAFKMKDLP